MIELGQVPKLPSMVAVGKLPSGSVFESPEDSTTLLMRLDHDYKPMHLASAVGVAARSAFVVLHGERAGAIGNIAPGTVVKRTTLKLRKAEDNDSD